MVTIGKVEALFDFDLIAGMILAVVLDYTLSYIAINIYTPLSGRPFGPGLTSPIDIFGYDDFVLFGIEIAGTLLAKGRTRKIFLSALWFTIFLKVCIAIQVATGVPFP